MKKLDISMKLIFSLLLILGLAGCGQHMVIHDMEPAYVSPDVENKKLHIEKSIIKACFDRKWTPSKVEDGKILASITVRNRYKISVMVTYDDQGFGISPVSTNMTKPFGRVHSKYNAWVANLHHQIASEIARHQE